MTAPAVAALLAPSAVYLLLVSAGLARTLLATRRAVTATAHRTVEQAEEYCRFAAITNRYEETDQ